MRRTRGFTVIELIVVLVVAGIGFTLFVTQKANIDAAARDDKRKTAINAMYYSLEEVYYAEKGYYPQEIDSKTLRAIDPALFADPDGLKLGDPLSTYHYEGTDCSNDGHCKHYTLSASLEREAEYTKNSRR